MKLDPNTVALLNQLGIDAGGIESLLPALILLTILSVVAAIPTVMLAGRKRRSRSFWLLFALTIPLLPLLLVWWLPELPGTVPAEDR